MRLAVIATVSRSIVANAHGKCPLMARALDPSRSTFRATGDSMADGIFCQRLHRERRNLKVECFLVDLYVYLQSVCITKVLEGKIFLSEVIFLGKLDQLAAIFFQGVAQHVPQAFDGTLRHSRAELHQSR